MLFYFDNGAFVSYFFFKMVLLAGASFVLSWCFFFKMALLAGAKFVLIWRFFLQIVLLAGANLCSSVAFLVLCHGALLMHLI